jgi:succinyl-diaminopimelate desuccinylase
MPTEIPAALARRLDETLLWLCGIPSPIGEEGPICDAIGQRLLRLELAAPVRRYMNSIVVPVSRGLPGPHIALVGHLDTVRTENGPARLEGGRCFGAGASDMKSGLSLMLVLAEAIAGREAPFESGPPCNLTLVFYAKEEGSFADNELGPVLDQDPELRAVDLAVCLEPSDNRLHLGCAGSIHATVTFEGRTAHSARPWEGENAITKAAPLLAELSARSAGETPIDGLVYRTVTTVTRASDGGRGRNVVPDTFVLNLNHRFSPDITLAQAQSEVRRIVGQGARLEFTDLSPAAMPNASHPLVQRLAAAGVRGTEPKQAWTDVARFSQAGIAAVNFGPGENAQAHQKNESTALARIHEGYQIVVAWLAGLGSA